MPNSAVKPLILVVEDDPAVRNLIVAALEAHGLRHMAVETAHAAIAAASSQAPSIVLLDLGLPDMDGVKVVESVRAWSGMPIIVVSARSEDADKIRALDAGADDYLAKPFGMMELISRVNALLRRASRPSQGAAEEVAEPSDLMAVGAIKLSPSARTVVANGREVNLTRKEFDLLRTLMENKGRVLTREQLLEQVWGVSFVGETRTVDMHVKTLRRKLAEAAPGSEEAVATVRGVGYRLKKSAS